MILGTSLRALYVAVTAAGWSGFWSGILSVGLLAAGGALVWFVQRRYAEARAVKQAKTIPPGELEAARLTVDQAMALVIEQNRLTAPPPVPAVPHAYTRAPWVAPVFRSSQPTHLIQDVIVPMLIVDAVENRLSASQGDLPGDQAAQGPPWSGDCSSDGAESSSDGGGDSSE
jgi:hypothetical protein